MSQTRESQARYVLGDWGTSRLRLWLVEHEEITATRAGPGIGRLTTTPSATLAELIAPWQLPAAPLRVVLSGMAGSRTGLIETDYVTVPADFRRWADGTQTTRIEGLSIAVAAGLRDDSRADAPDVMRGEETQIFGALELEPALQQGTHLFVLPGTHSKWVRVDDGTITRISTALTGELFALLRDHSILLKTGADARPDPTEQAAGFAAGVARSRVLSERLLSALFTARTAQLLAGRSHAWASGFLSGLLIGDEIAGQSALQGSPNDVVLIGASQLTRLYEQALGEHDIDARLIDGDTCALAGLQQLYDTVQGALL